MFVSQLAVAHLEGLLRFCLRLCGLADKMNYLSCCLLLEVHINKNTWIAAGMQNVVGVGAQLQHQRDGQNWG